MIFAPQMWAFTMCVLIAIIGMPSCAAKEAQLEWITECVGQMELDFPGGVDAATNSAKMLIAEHKVGSIQPRFEFEDGQDAGWSKIHFLGRLYVSAPLNVSERDLLENLARDSVVRAQEWADKNKNTKKGEPLFFEPLSVKPHIGSASRVDSTYSARLFIGPSMIWLKSSGAHSTWEAQRKNFNTFLTGVVSRPIGISPSEPGICLPYFFIKSDNFDARDIGITYRLKAHPDITVWLEDASAVAYDEPIREKNAQPEYRLNDFWSQYEYTKTGKQVDTIWRYPATRPVKLAGQEGLASFVRITRKDSSIDYGYFAAVRGDPKAKEDVPDLRFYVIREAAHAKAKGIEPISEKDFLEMAQAIAASIRHRTKGK